jgi:hypothetical protein
MSPAEQELVDRFRALTGSGLSEQVRQALLAKLPAAVAMLEDMLAAGLSPGELPPTEQVVYVETDAERRALREDTFEPRSAAPSARSATP